MAQQVVYRTFLLQDQAEEVIAYLKDHEIPAVLGGHKPQFDTPIFGSNFQQLFEVRIAPEHFELADSYMLIKPLAIPDQHQNYINSFSDEALFQILTQPDLWSHYDYDLAYQLLKQRGIELTGKELNQLKEKRNEALSKPEQVSTVVFVLGYVALLFGGIIGAFIGYTIWVSKKTLPNGVRVFQYTNAHRNQGKFLFSMGTIVSMLFLVIAVWNSFR